MNNTFYTKKSDDYFETVSSLYSMNLWPFEQMSSLLYFIVSVVPLSTVSYATHGPGVTSPPHLSHRYPASAVPTMSPTKHATQTSATTAFHFFMTKSPFHGRHEKVLPFLLPFGERQVLLLIFIIHHQENIVNHTSPIFDSSDNFTPPAPASWQSAPAAARTAPAP